MSEFGRQAAETAQKGCAASVVIPLNAVVRGGKLLAGWLRRKQSPAVELPDDGTLSYPDFSKASSTEKLIEQTYTWYLLDAISRDDSVQAKRLLREMVRIQVEYGYPGWMKGRTAQETDQRMDREVDNILSDRTVILINDSDGQLRPHCGFCHNPVIPEEGCPSCRVGAGPPRRSPEEALKMVEETYAGPWSNGLVPRMSDVLETYLRFVHSPIQPDIMFVDMRSLPPHISEEDWNRMSELQRRDAYLVVCIWLGREGMGGYVGRSKRSYGDLKQTWNRTGRPPYADPGVFESLGIQAGYAEVSERFGYQFREGPLPTEAVIWIAAVDREGEPTGPRQEMTVGALKMYFGGQEG